MEKLKRKDVRVYKLGSPVWQEPWRLRFRKKLKRDVRVYKISSSGGYSDREWFEKSIVSFKSTAPSARFEDYEYVQVVPMASWKKFPSGNDGSQGWRHKATGYTIPDYCRQTQGCPDMWYKGRYKQLLIAENSPILHCLIKH